MSWLDSYRTASFRGLEFHVESHDAKFGRRQVTHEFPQRDEPYTEDLGRKAREFTVDAYLIGDDYPAKKNRLIDACESEGPGELVHPYLGNMEVVCTGLTVRESVSDLRMCRLQISFVEAGQAKFPTNVADPVRSVSAAATKVTSAAGTGFLSRFTTNGFPSFVIDSAAGRVQGLSSLLQNLTANPVAEAQTVAGFFNRVRALGNDALELVTTPATLVAEITGIVGSIRSVFGSRADGVLRSVRAAYEAPYSGLASTSNRRQERENHDAFSAVIRRAAVAEQAKFAVLQAEASADGQAPTSDAPNAFQTREDALAVRDELTTTVDVEIEDPSTTTEEYQALTLLRSELVRNVPSPELRLPQVATVIPPSTLPSLVVAYQVYEDADRSVEIAERNRARHPGFLPGAEPLEVVTDG